MHAGFKQAVKKDSGMLSKNCILQVPGIPFDRIR
jgi:hypothetical protein